MKNFTNELNKYTEGYPEEELFGFRKGVGREEVAGGWKKLHNEELHIFLLFT